MSSPIESQSVEEAPESQKINLQLSDVIRLQSPSNQILNNNTFVIDYIDKNQINLINVNDLTANKIKINEDGTLGDGSITSIALIDRNDKLDMLDKMTFFQIHGLIFILVETLL